MRSFKNWGGLTVASAVVAVGLAGCAGSTTATAPTAAQVGTFVSEVQQYASAACAFEPTAITVAQIAAASSASATASVALAQQIAGQLCAAVTTKSSRRGTALAPHVGRVVVHGTFEDGRRI